MAMLLKCYHLPVLSLSPPPFRIWLAGSCSLFKSQLTHHPFLGTYCWFLFTDKVNHLFLCSLTAKCAHLLDVLLIPHSTLTLGMGLLSSPPDPERCCYSLNTYLKVFCNKDKNKNCLLLYVRKECWRRNSNGLYALKHSGCTKGRRNPDGGVLAFLTDPWHLLSSLPQCQTFCQHWGGRGRNTKGYTEN